ncbi:CYH2 protein, partial [Sakesphorus luctuosus]|nr:CYH2 protein [Sakesphorus luctuosus]
QGIQFLVEQELLRPTAEDIARFLCKGEGLNKTAIGDYLGERGAQVCLDIPRCHLGVPRCVLGVPRQFLWSFRLPGEAQKIDRMMEAFAQRYCLCNP